MEKVSEISEINAPEVISESWQLIKMLSRSVAMSLTFWWVFKSREKNKKQKVHWEVNNRVQVASNKINFKVTEQHTHLIFLAYHFQWITKSINKCAHMSEAANKYTQLLCFSHQMESKMEFQQWFHQGVNKLLTKLLLFKYLEVK